VFIESLFAFSEHPLDASTVRDVEPSPVFDLVFAPFRPDRGGSPVDASEISEEIDPLATGEACPASTDRSLEISCAVFVLGSLIGTITSHELGHSMGLANPYEKDNFHDRGERSNRLMDATRPFLERAELFGYGPSRFCEDSYFYLRTILPTDAPPDTMPRPPCE
jgi:hypothetical protein